MPEPVTEPATGSVTGSRRCGVLGSPIAHSLSPVMHRAAYAALGLDWSYDTHRVEAAGLPDFVAACAADPRWRGLSLTMPLKHAVLPLLDAVSDTARRAGAVNTVLLEPGRRMGHNTDVAGVRAALVAAGAEGLTRAVVLGAGATAESAVVALSELGLRRLHVAVRSPSRAAGVLALAGRLGVEATVGHLHAAAPGEVDALVSTVPSGGADVVPDQQLGRARLVLDAVYDPYPSPLLGRAAAQGAVVVEGIELLAHQAVGQVALMTGREVAVDVLRAAALARLRSPGGRPTEPSSERPSEEPGEGS